MDRITCRHCGREYRVTWMTIGMRDQDREICACGEQLYRWDGSRIPEFTLIEHNADQSGLTKPPDPAKP